MLMLDYGLSCRWRSDALGAHRRGRHVWRWTAAAGSLHWLLNHAALTVEPSPAFSEIAAAFAIRLVLVSAAFALRPAITDESFRPEAVSSGTVEGVRDEPFAITRNRNFDELQALKGAGVVAGGAETNFGGAREIFKRFP